MAELPDEVMPGELISSEWFNLLLAKIGELDAQVEQLSGSLPAGTVTVPNVFGKPLSEARQIIGLPALQLALGNVFDAFGASINPNVVSSFGLTVLGQYPVPGAKAMPGSAVNLVVAAVPGSGTPTPSQAPTITGFIQPQTPIGEIVEIIGTNFVMPIDDNTVTFGNVPTEPLFGSNILSLIVKVPDGIPNAPNEGQPGVPVTVRVETANGNDTAQHIILPPLEGPPPPTITLPVIPAIPVVNQQMTINGANFAPIVQQNIIHFDAITVPASTASPTQLRVVVPNGVINAPGFKFVNLRVEVITNPDNPRISAPIPGGVRMQRP